MTIISCTKEEVQQTIPLLGLHIVCGNWEFLKSSLVSSSSSNITALQLKISQCASSIGAVQDEEITTCGLLGAAASSYWNLQTIE